MLLIHFFVLLVFFQRGYIFGRINLTKPTNIYIGNLNLRAHVEGGGLFHVRVDVSLEIERIDSHT